VNARRSVVLFAVVFASLLEAGIALAQRNLAVKPAADSEQRVALVIGNSAYKEGPLSNPVNDATDIAKALGEVGFKVILKRNANTREMRQAIREFGSELKRAQVGLFYFAGHGVQVKGANYLMPVGADIQNEADAEDLAVDANYALRTMEDAQVRVSIVILDACRNNPFVRSFRSTARGLATMNAATGSIVAFSTAPGSVAADGAGRNGIYTKHLLASMREGDPDILKVFQRTRAAVVKETGGRQTPWESTSLVGDFYFRTSASLGQQYSGERAGESTNPTNPQTQRPAGTAETWVVKLGAYADKENASRLEMRLKTVGIQSYTETSDSNQGLRTRVRAGPYATRAAAERVQEKLKEMGVNGAVSER
jgi:hypothetical protein